MENSSAVDIAPMEGAMVGNAGSISQKFTVGQTLWLQGLCSLISKETGKALCLAMTIPAKRPQTPFRQPRQECVKKQRCAGRRGRNRPPRAEFLQGQNSPSLVSLVRAEIRAWAILEICAWENLPLAKFCSRGLYQRGQDAERWLLCATS